jgi:BirA family biotin operon repressor/biotin-[acetyl-CoA-carboxylase] ligase
MNNLFYLSQCTSTQDEIENFINMVDSDFPTVVTFHQTKGKGQYGNTWESNKNLNVAYSMAIPVELIKLQDHLFNFRTAECLADFVAILTKETPQIKWPNDLILKNKKIAGILIEKKFIKEKYWFVIGIGLNVNQENFEAYNNAGSLRTQTGKHFDLEEIVEALHVYFQNHLMQEISQQSVIDNLNQRLFRKNVISVFEIRGVRQNGIIKEVDEKGFLWVALENEGLKKFFHKEISLLY